MHRTTRRVLVTGVTGAAILGSGATALAMTSETASTSSATAATVAATSPTSTTPAAKKRHPLLRRAVSGQIVTRGKGGYVTHDLIRGAVTAVSSTSISVKAADGKSATYVVNSATKVRARSNGKGAPSTIGKVATGDRVLVAGTGTSTLTAKHIVDTGKKK